MALIVCRAVSFAGLSLTGFRLRYRGRGVRLGRLVPVDDRLLKRIDALGRKAAALAGAGAGDNDG